MKILLSLISILLLSNCNATAQSQRKIVGGGCDGCDLIYNGMPRQLNSETNLAEKSEPGEPLEISGVIYKADGKTPAAGVILYVYQTSAKGEYEPLPGKPEIRHGRLRGWMKTDDKGRYKFHTIRPAAYPGRKDPAHIHPVIKEPDKNEYYIDEYRFDDDPLLTRAERAREEKRGGSGIIRLTRDQRGVWIGRRDITLGLNIPNYR
jgi:protocatechuate 3,4-dioxygenase beta subunit